MHISTSGHYQKVGGQYPRTPRDRRHWMEGWVDLVDLITSRPGVEPATFRSRVRRRTAAPPRQPGQDSLICKSVLSCRESLYSIILVSKMCVCRDCQQNVIVVVVVAGKDHSLATVPSSNKSRFIDVIKANDRTVRELNRVGGASYVWRHQTARCADLCDLHQSERPTVYTVSQKTVPTYFLLLVTMISWASMRHPVWIHCCKRPNYDFCISQGSAATVLRWGGQNWSHLGLCRVSSRCWVPKIVKIG